MVRSTRNVGGKPARHAKASAKPSGAVKKPAATKRATRRGANRTERVARAELGVILDRIHRTIDETEALLAG